MFWLFFSIIVLSLTLLGDPNNHLVKGASEKLIFRILLVITLSSLIALGGEVGTDHPEYADWYNKLANFKLSNFLSGFGFSELNRDTDGFEIGFVLLGYTLYKIGFSELGFFFVMAIITNTFLVKVLYRFKHPVFSMVLFLISQYYFQECNLVRQMLAVSIFLYSLKFLENKDVKRYVICILVAASFHFSALLLLVLIFLCYVNFDKWGLLLLAVYFSIWVLSLLILTERVNLDSLFESFSLGYYQLYLDNLYGEGHDERPFEIRYNIIVFIVLITSIILKLRKSPDANIRYCYILVLVIGIFFSNISLKFYWLYRVAVYFATIFCFVAPDFLSKIKLFKFEKNYSILEVIIMLWYISDLIIKYIFNPKVLLGSKFVFD